ncbi:hypothetical protein [Endozoicomonas euniceicola]|uniref:Uncharacterized protein n=1 Tax=Endozoicomonas euniceicola TaxID=1234143 RepID=A0ABY6GR93_9GAMM|nr:hypothetical protein [Endozoicomonas euniceicola]UYM14608.1 hypothetical protein NX720_17145 [Endozoicomonas euniceicola]
MLIKGLLAISLSLMFTTKSFSSNQSNSTTPKVYQTSPAQDRLVLPPDDELRIYKEKLDKFKTIKHNDRKKMAWQQGPIMLGINVAYRVTGDITFLNQSLKMSDEILAVRNHPEEGKTLYVSNKKLPVWPTLHDDFKVNGEKKPFANIIMTAMILQPIAENFRLIMESPGLWNEAVPFGEEYLKGSGTTYREKALFYFEKIEETIDQFVLAFWYDPLNNLLRIPDNSRMEDIQPELAGLYPAYNRSLAMMQVLDDLARGMELAKKKPHKASVLRSMVKKQLDTFFDDIKTYKHNGKKYIYWFYAPADRESGQEDSKHGRLVMQAITKLYNDGNNPYGLTKEKLQPFIDLFLDRLLTSNGSKVHYFIHRKNMVYRNIHIEPHRRINRAGAMTGDLKDDISYVTPYVILGWAGDRVMKVIEENMAKKVSLKWTPWLWYYRNFNKINSQ